MGEINTSISLRFANFELCRDPLRLLKSGTEVKLRHQALQLLDLLARHPRELVRHDTIRDALWSERVVDHVGGTHLLIREIRKALDDDANHPRFVETVPRYGYRFIAEVAEGPIAPHGRDTDTKRRLWRFGAVAATIVGTGIAVGMFVGGLEPATANRSPVGEAQSAFEKGQYLRLRRGSDNYTESSTNELEMAAAYLETAIQLDPKFAAAHASVAAIYDLQGKYDLAEEHAQEAIEFDAEHADAYVTLALVAMNRDWAWQHAEEYLHNALALDPGSVSAYSAKARLMIILGRRDEAKEAAQKALELDSVTAALRTDNGWYHYYAGDYEAGLRICTEATLLNPDYWIGYECQLRAAVMLGDSAAASLAAAGIASTWDEIPDIVAQLRENPGAASLAAFFAYRGPRIERLRERPTFCLDRGAAAMAEMGLYEVAASMINDAIESRAYRLPFALRDPVFDPMRDDPRFQAAVQVARIPDTSSEITTVLAE